MKKVFCGLILVAMSAMAHGAPVTDYAIVTGRTVNPETATALNELKGAIRAISGKDFPASAKRKIYLGDTEFAAAAGLSQKNLAAEEWVIQSVGDDLIVTGGMPRGVLYAVYELLERAAGVRYCSINYTFYPSNPAFSLPDSVHWRGKPFFANRDVYYLTRDMPKPDFYRSQSRYRLNASGNLPEFGFAARPGYPHNTHSYLIYTQDFPENIGWMNRHGKRINVRSTTDGQLCYTHPEVRRRIVARLREFIAKDRAECARTGAPFPTIYEISANDCDAACHCPPCRKFIAAHHVSGLVLDFTNAVAQAIAADFPEIQIMMFAYKDTMIPPQGGIKAAANVIVRLAFMDVEFGAGPKTRDVLRPIDSAQNRWYFDTITAWQQCAANLAIWDYWKLYYDAFPSPKGYIRNRAGYIRKYRDIGATGIFIEAEIDAETQMESFTDLRTYFAARLMIDPALDSEAVIADFMAAFYGAAAQPMGDYLNLLEKCTAAEPRPLGFVHVGRRVGLDADFFAEADRLLTQAEAATANDPARRANVAQERLIADLALVNLFPDLPEKAKILERIAPNYSIYGRKYYRADYWCDKGPELLQTILAKLDRPALPPEFAHRNVKDLAWPEFQRVVSDSDAAGGKCQALSNNIRNAVFREPPHGRAAMLGIYDNNRKAHLLKLEIPKSELPRDEKFHWFYLGRTVLTENASLWAHWTWFLGVSLRSVYDRAAPDRAGDIYASIKVQGPSYVPGSKLPDDFKLDRIIVIPASGAPPALGARLPEAFSGFECIDITGSDLKHTIFDAAASGNRARAISNEMTKYTKPEPPHGRNLMFGCYDSVTGKYPFRREVPKAQLPRDEKYHLYYAGRGKIPATAGFWAHWTWFLGAAPPAQLDPNALYDAYFSIKVQGPAYVEGSKLPDDCRLDRIVLVKSIPGKTDQLIQPSSVKEQKN